jgi:hypothetical protein
LFALERQFRDAVFFVFGAAFATTLVLTLHL